MNADFELDLATDLRVQTLELAPPADACSSPPVLAAVARSAYRRRRRARAVTMGGVALVVAAGLSIVTSLGLGGDRVATTPPDTPRLAPINDQQERIAPLPDWAFTPSQALVAGAEASPGVLTGARYDPGTQTFRVLTTDVAAGQRLADDVERSYDPSRPVVVVLVDHSLDDLKAMMIEVVTAGEVEGSQVTYTEVSPHRGVFRVALEDPTDAARAALYSRYGDAVEVIEGAQPVFGTGDGSLPPTP